TYSSYLLSFILIIRTFPWSTLFPYTTLFRSFYSQQFGWEQDGDMDMGPMGKYEFLKVGDERGFMLGALMPKPDEMPQSAWTYYFRVPDIDKAVVAINANGGTVTWEPTEIPGGDYSLSAIDPQGANFALVGPRK